MRTNWSKLRINVWRYNDKAILLSLLSVYSNYFSSAGERILVNILRWLNVEGNIYTPNIGKHASRSVDSEYQGFSLFYFNWLFCHFLWLFWCFLLSYLFIAWLILRISVFIVYLSEDVLRIWQFWHELHCQIKSREIFNSLFQIEVDLILSCFYALIWILTLFVCISQHCVYIYIHTNMYWSMSYESSYINKYNCIRETRFVRFVQIKSCLLFNECFDLHSCVMCMLISI